MLSALLLICSTERCSSLLSDVICLMGKIVGIPQKVVLEVQALKGADVVDKMGP